MALRTTPYSVHGTQTRGSAAFAVLTFTLYLALPNGVPPSVRLASARQVVVVVLATPSHPVNIFLSLKDLAHEYEPRNSDNRGLSPAE